MSCTSLSPTRRRLLAATLALPLSLAMTGTALAGSGLGAGSPSAELRTTGAGNSNAADNAANKAAADKQADKKAEADAAALRTAEASKPGPGAAAGKAAGSSAMGPHVPAAKSAEKPAPKAAAPKAAAPKAAPQPAAAKPAAQPSKGAQHGPATSGPLTSPQPLSKADKNGTGANPGNSCTHAYCSTRDGSASGNGNGNGAAKGKPCAGCVGKADNKNPKGQAPNGKDHNAGYECDRNNGIGKTNPAHTGCSAADTDPRDPKGPKDPKDPKGPKDPKDPKGPKDPKDPKGPKDPKDPKGPKDPGNGNGGNGADKVTICHATGSASNPYVIISPSKKGVLNGHAGHGRDIIPPFSYTDNKGVTTTFPGQGDQGLYGNGCAVPGAEVPTTPTCPTSPVTGPVMDGCEPETPPTTGGGDTDTDTEPIGGVTPGQPATNPTTPGKGNSPAAVVGNGAVTPAVLPAGSARTSSVPTTLPFTGTDAALLVALGAVLLAAGGGTTLAARRERTARTTV